MASFKRNIQTFTIKRPWGQFDQFTRNEATTVKVHSINPHSSFSLQYHNRRAELVRVLFGHPIITIGEKKINAKPGDEFMIERLEKHRIETNNDAAQILEIAYGDFDEDDTIRIEDNYGRA